jgi:hypothetical protein
VIYTIHDFEIQHREPNSGIFIDEVQRRYLRNYDIVPLFFGKFNKYVRIGDLNRPISDSDITFHWTSIVRVINAYPRLHWSIHELDGAVGSGRDGNMKAGQEMGLLKPNWVSYRDKRIDDILEFGSSSSSNGSPITITI